MSPARRKVYTTLAGRPCIHVRALARELRVAAPTASWHVRRLVRAGLVQQERHGRRMVFYPVGLLPPEDVPLLAIINSAVPGRILETLRKNPGLALGQLQKAMGGAGLTRPLRALLKVGGISTITDGRYRRFYVSPRLAERDRDSRKRTRQFQRDLLRHLARDGLAPRVVRAREGELELEVREGPKPVTMIVPLRPFGRFARSE